MISVAQALRIFPTRPLISSNGLCDRYLMALALAGVLSAPRLINMEADGTGEGVEETKRLELIGQQVDEASMSPSSHVHSRSWMNVAAG
ncbi:uncharacterized protein TrAtP1_002750 [Trichoderma atroviride]|uniref:uncharacterized protein n=1 Tax=Hypocrea atroviridis TaxID=63577 RepID=UPI003333EEEB|nr:hypothetical protein TrAtP1_002750 [Trichoderma atroviride]